MPFLPGQRSQEVLRVQRVRRLLPGPLCPGQEGNRARDRMLGARDVNFEIGRVAGPIGRPVLGLTAWWLGQAASARPHTPLDHHTKQQLLRIGSRARSSHRATKLLSIARNSSAVWSHSCALVGSIGRRPARPLLRTRDDRPMAGPICRLSVLAAIVEGTRALCRRHCRHASRVLVCSSPVFRHGSFAASIRFFQTSGNPAVCAKMFLWRF